MAVGATCAFAANPFVDVPSDSWAYKSVVELADAGIIQGVDGQYFQGQRNITRYEAAEMVGADKEAYLAALTNSIHMYSETGLMDPKGAETVLAVFSAGSPDVAAANVDLSKTYTNAFVEKARAGQ